MGKARRATRKGPDPKRLARLIHGVELRSVTAEEGTFVNEGLVSYPYSGRGRLGVENAVVHSFAREGDRLLARIAYMLRISPVAKKKKGKLTIGVTFLLVFEPKEGVDLDDFSEPEFNLFAGGNGQFLSWPYFREFAQSTAARMGLLQIVAPLLTIGEFEKPATARKKAQGKRSS